MRMKVQGRIRRSTRQTSGGIEEGRRKREKERTCIQSVIVPSLSWVASPRGETVGPHHGSSQCILRDGTHILPCFLFLFLTRRKHTLMTLQLSRLLRLPRDAAICNACRSFGTSAGLFSGHSKWATIKHDKAKNDKAKSKERQMMSKDISNATQCMCLRSL